MVLALFCAIRYIDDLRYLRGDEDSMETVRRMQRTANLKCKAAAMKSRENYRMQQVLQVAKLRHVRVGEELFVNYGVKNWLG